MSDTVKINDTEIHTDGRYVYNNPRKLIAWEDAADQVEWRDEAVRTREVALALMEALEWMISNEPQDSPKRGVLVSRAAIAQAKAVLRI